MVPQTSGSGKSSSVSVYETGTGLNLDVLESIVLSFKFIEPLIIELRSAGENIIHSLTSQ